MKINSMVLKPIVIKKNFFNEAEKEIYSVLYEEIILPLYKEMGVDLVENSQLTAVAYAIRTGKITFAQGLFKGKFNSTISKELRGYGATWSSFRRGFLINKAKLPQHVQYEISLSDHNIQRMVDRMDKKLRKIVPEEMVEKINVVSAMEKTLSRFESDMDQSLRSISVKEKISDTRREEISRKYQKDVKRYIKDWTEEEIFKLREKISADLLSGKRTSDFVETVSSFGLSSRSKAKFIARQETALYLSTLKETRYAERGIYEYIWRVSNDGHPIRADHLRLDKTTQRFDKPPVTNLKTGARNNPSEDYNCYCTAWPIVKFS